MGAASAFNRQFGIIFWGKLFAIGGVWAHGMAAAVVTFAATGSALMVGAVSTAQFLPQIVLPPPSGKLTDRGHAIAQTIVGRLICGFGSTGLAVWMGIFRVPDGLGATLAGQTSPVVAFKAIGTTYVIFAIGLLTFEVAAPAPTRRYRSDCARRPQAPACGPARSNFCSSV